MVLGKLFGGEVRELAEDEYIELNATESDDSKKVPIKVEKLDDFADSDRIQKLVRDGSIVLAKIKTLKEKDILELKRAIDKLRKTCVAINGDVAGIDEDWIILTPNSAKIHRD